MPVTDFIEPMDGGEVQRRRKALSQALDRLAHEVEYKSEWNDIARQFEYIYSGGYRQMYSELYPILLKIYHGPEGDLDMLVSNLENLRSFVGEDYKQAEGKRAYSPYLYGRILKLSDHINLEYQRLMESDEVRKEISRMSTERRKLENKTRKAMKKAKNLQLEVISILAIFAAIVIAFAGGLNMLGGALSGIAQAETLDLLSVLSLCGIILFNTVSFLMHVVFWIIRRLHDNAEDGSRLIDTKYLLWFNFGLFAKFIVTTLLANLDSITSLIETGSS